MRVSDSNTSAVYEEGERQHRSELGGMLQNLNMIDQAISGATKDPQPWTHFGLTPRTASCCEDRCGNHVNVPVVAGSF